VASDSSHHEYHLTPNGWVAGTRYYINEKLGDKKTPPADRIETWVRDMIQASGWSNEQVTWSCTWTSPDYSEKQRKALRKKHPKPAEDFPG